MRPVFLLLSLVTASAQTWSNVDRVVAIGDVHGDYEQFVTLLRQAKLVDGKNQWIGGKAHLVQTGDIPDRGPDTRKALDLLMDLEKQAQRAGGRVHALIGNHEAMMVYGDLAYTTPEEFAAFRTPESEELRERYFQRVLEGSPEAALAAKADERAFRAKWEAEHPLGWVEHRLAYGPEGKYGKWIRGHNAVIKVNDSIFLHGGISPKYVTMSLKDINDKIREELKDLSKLEGGAIVDSDGPLWYRGLAVGDVETMAPHVDAVLQAYGARRIVIGHTVTDGTVIPRFGGRVLMIDAGMSKIYGSRLACLILEQGKAYVLHRGEQFEIPMGASTEALVNYLEKAASLDPKPSPLTNAIEELTAAPATAP
jgi:Calcineurin-like phosphoesterase